MINPFGIILALLGRLLNLAAPRYQPRRTAPLAPEQGGGPPRLTLAQPRDEPPAGERSRNPVS